MYVSYPFSLSKIIISCFAAAFVTHFLQVTLKFAIIILPLRLSIISTMRAFYALNNPF